MESADHVFTAPLVHEIIVERGVLDNDNFNSPPEPAEDYSECIIHYAKRLAEEAVNE